MHGPCGPWCQAKVAVGFLTRLPIRFPEDTPPLGRVAWAFPLAGLLVGGLGGGVLLGAAWFGLPPLVCALLALGAQALLTGGLHEDGLADVADGFGGGRGDKARILEIMRDSRVGTFGVLAVVLSLGLRAAALGGYVGPGIGALALVAGATVSRGALPLAMRLLPPARGDGLGHGAGRPGTGNALAAFVGGSGVALVALYLVIGPVAALAAWAVGLVAALLLGWYAKHRIGGQTGDVLGGMQQVAEIALLVAVGVVA